MPRPAGSSRARRSTRAASPRTTRCSTSVKPKIAAALAEAAQSGVRDTHALSQVVRRTIGRWVNQQLRRRPDDRAARHRGVGPGPIDRGAAWAPSRGADRLRSPVKSGDGDLPHPPGHPGRRRVPRRHGRRGRQLAAGRRASQAPGAHGTRAQPLRRRMDAAGRCRVHRAGRRRRADRRGVVPAAAAQRSGIRLRRNRRARAHHRRAADLARARRGPRAPAGA